nr:MAG TPA: hypothetical protein [Caudoviricetes sp.]
MLMVCHLCQGLEALHLVHILIYQSLSKILLCDTHLGRTACTFL